MRFLPSRLALLLLVFAQPALAESSDPVVGLWRATEGTELAAMLELNADGHFRYQLAYGALDERAEGSWHRVDDTLRLDTIPKPRPPAFSVHAMRVEPGKPLTLHVTTADGHGITGIDFRIGFASGEPVLGYTQDYGWSMDASDPRQPIWVELAEPINGVASARFVVRGGANDLHFVLTPNDIGVVDFAGAAITVDGDTLTLAHPRGGALHFRRAQP